MQTLDDGTGQPDAAAESTASEDEVRAVSGAAGRLDGATLQIVFLLGLLAFAGGVYVLRDTSIGADIGNALSAVASQLPLTLAPALIVLAATALNFAAGAVCARAVSGVPFTGFTQAILAGLAGAVLLDTLMMTVLGLAGLFGWPLLLALNIGLLLAATKLRPFFVAGQPAARIPVLGPIGWLLVAVVWSGPIFLQLASPVVPFNDVPPNHVAPVEHLRTFGSLSSLDMTFSPIYGPSRIFLGYQALLGTIATIGDVPGVRAAASFALPLALLIAIAGCALARAIGGQRAAAWALLLVPLSVTFLRLGDARAGVLGFALAALALWLTIEPLGATVRRQAVVLALVLTATIFAHPLVGLFATLTVGLAGLAWPRRYAAYGLPAALAAPILALPQWAATLGIDAASATALVALPGAALVLATLTSRRFDWLKRSRVPGALVAAGLVLGALAGAMIQSDAVGNVLAGMSALIGDYTVLLAGSGIAVLAALRYRGFEILVVGVVAGLISGSIAIGGAGLTPLGGALQYEVPKAVTYYAPTLLAIAGAIGLAAVWARSNLKLPVRAAIAAVVLVGAASPIRSGVVQVLSLGEHRFAETFSISMHTASSGYWQGYPDVRLLVNGEQQELIAALRTEIAAGRLTDATNVLHVAHTWRSDVAPSYATPLGVFAGVVETTATTDPEESIHTAGGRLRDIADLDTMLGPEFPYVVVEGGGLPADVPSRISAAGYVLVFANEKGQVFALLG